MLDPQDRSVYLEALKPPPCYRLDRAVGTTYSVDLLSLLAIPLSFAQLDWSEDREALLADPVRLLRSLRDQSGRITLFCQTGRIAMPARRHALFAHLESMLVESAVPVRPGGAPAEFHAKTWLLRFVGKEEDPVKYRFLCLSRNLTTDRSWDTILSVEGDLDPDRKVAFARNHPLADFVEALPAMAKHGSLDPERHKAILAMAAEARKVRFVLPEPFEELEFVPLGIDGHRGADLATGDASRVLVVSPFLSKTFLSKSLLAKERRAGEMVLVSRQESLDEVGPELVRKFDRVFVVDEDTLAAREGNEVFDVGGELSATAAESMRTDERGLHAKLYVVERGWNADVWTGSANASTAAFGRNVEFMVRLTGKKSQVGLARLLGEDGKSTFTLMNLLQAYRIPEAPIAADEEAAENERIVEETRRRLAGAGLRWVVNPGQAEGLFDATVRAAAPLTLPEGVRGRCWPATLRVPQKLNLAALMVGPVTFERLSLPDLTAFLAFDVRAGEGDKERAARFALLLPLEGVPASRMDDLLASMLQEPGQFVRLLLLLLTDQDLDPAAAADLVVSRETNGRGERGSQSEFPLLEELLRTLSRAPERLAAVQSLVTDLKRARGGAKVLPDGFDNVWNAIWEARPQR